MAEKGIFLGFVLLRKPQWDKDAFFERLRKKWDIVPEGITDSEEGTVVFDHNSMVISAAFVPAPVPDKEAEKNAAFNYMWRTAADEVSAHTAQIIVSVMKGSNALDNALEFTKVCDSLIDDNTIGIYTNGTVYKPDVYSGVAQAMKENILPVLDLVWIGVTNTGGGRFNGYTMGLEHFGKYEIEVLGCTQPLSKLVGFVMSIAEYIIAEDVTLRDGETIGFTAGQRLAITLSDGVEFDYKTLKIEYPND